MATYKEGHVHVLKQDLFCRYTVPFDWLSKRTEFVKSKRPVRREIGGWVSGDMANDGKSAAADSGIEIQPNWKSRRKSGKVNI